MKYIHIECDKCGAKDEFIDPKAIEAAKWIIFAWRVQDNIPLCLCPKCKI